MGYRTVALSKLSNKAIAAASGMLHEAICLRNVTISSVSLSSCSPE